MPNVNRNEQHRKTAPNQSRKISNTTRDTNNNHKHRCGHQFNARDKDTSSAELF